MTDGEFGAIYFPWIKTSVTGINALLPPSGAMAGIFARTTLRDGPQVAPANERLEKVTGLAYHVRSEEHTSELQSLMRISYAVFCLKKKQQLTLIQPQTRQ